MDVISTGPVLIPTLGSASLSGQEYGSYAKSTSEGLSGLPVGYPTHLGQAFSWTGKQLQDRELHFVYNLNEKELIEIRSAKDHFKCKPFRNILYSLI